MQFVTVYQTLSPGDAERVRSQLSANDFLVTVKNETAALSISGYSLAAGGILVQVSEDQAEDARALLGSSEIPENNE